MEDRFSVTESTGIVSYDRHPSMGLELFVVVALVVVFIISFCGLLQKIRHNYEQEREPSRSGTITISEIYITSPNHVNRATEVEDSVHSGVFPATIAPPPYTEYMEPPPKYDDIVKTQRSLPGVHRAISNVPNPNPSSVVISY